MKGVLYHFVTDFVKKVFLDQIFFAVTEKTKLVTRGELAMTSSSNCVALLLLLSPV